ncbi:hypothetical protein EDC24_1355 [Aquisalibacillus elongatus]|uniref:Uncharacterized protein n=1 Tax=Aquisalibacillus elongatus TaxID=485577 RepID=A0A3N5B9T6_9BACI|nr:hypothetical protein EDC24_1355 [Aquisalibacillus elongatus]
MIPFSGNIGNKTKIVLPIISIIFGILFNVFIYIDSYVYTSGVFDIINSLFAVILYLFQIISYGMAVSEKHNLGLLIICTVVLSYNTLIALMFIMVLILL